MKLTKYTHDMFPFWNNNNINNENENCNQSVMLMTNTDTRVENNVNLAAKIDFSHMLLDSQKLDKDCPLSNNNINKDNSKSYDVQELWHIVPYKIPRPKIIPRSERKNSLPPVRFENNFVDNNPTSPNRLTSISDTESQKSDGYIAPLETCNADITAENREISHQCPTLTENIYQKLLDNQNKDENLRDHENNIINHIFGHDKRNLIGESNIYDKIKENFLDDEISLDYSEFNEEEPNKTQSEITENIYAL